MFPWWGTQSERDHGVCVTVIPLRGGESTPAAEDRERGVEKYRSLRQEKHDDERMITE
jgi:hypothetical protein